MSFSIDRPTSHIVLVELGQFFDFREADEIKSGVHDALEEGARIFVFDADETQMMDSSGLGVLISLRRKLNQTGDDGDILIVGPTESVASTLELSSTKDAFTIIDEMRTAEERLSASLS